MFGPKVIANRNRFSDYALETRCLTYETEERSVRRDIPRQLPPSFFEEARELRNKLVKWRFENFERIKPQENALLHLEPRLTQIGAAIYSVSDDPAFQQRLIAFLVRSGTEQRTERPQAVVVEAIVRATKTPGGCWLTVGAVAGEARQIAASLGMSAEDFSPKRVGSLIRSMGIAPRKSGEGYRFHVTPETLEALAKRYGVPMGAGETVNVVNM